jgi:hypothetical protein
MLISGISILLAKPNVVQNASWKRWKLTPHFPTPNSRFVDTLVERQHQILGLSLNDLMCDAGGITEVSHAKEVYRSVERWRASAANSDR